MIRPARVHEFRAVAILESEFIGLALVLVIALTTTSAAFGALPPDTTQNIALFLTPSPELLGPVAQTGRKSWDCQPEQAAASGNASSAELPTAGTAPGD
jgi:hypothetical protein